MDPIGGSYPLPNVHRSVLIYSTLEEVRLLQYILRRLAGPDKFGLRRQVDVSHISQCSDVHGVFLQSVSEAVVRVAEQHE